MESYSWINFKKDTKLRKWLGSHHPFIYILVALFVIGLGTGGYFFFFYNDAHVANAQKLTSETAINQDIQIYYNKKIVHNAKITIAPMQSFDTTWKDTLNSTTITVHPTDKWKLGTMYAIDATNAKSIYTLNMPVVATTFKTQISPSVSDTSPKNMAENVVINTNLALKLNSANNDLIDPVFTIDPPVTNTIKLSDDKLSYTVTFAAPLAQSTQYTYRLYNKFFPGETGEAGKFVYIGKFSTIPRLNVVSLSPGKAAFVESPVGLAFDQDVNQKSIESSFSISPAMAGTFSWSDNRTLVYTPSTKLAFNSTYTVGVAKGARGANNSFLEADYSGTFSTIGYVTASFSPGWGATEVVPNTAIKTYFNQEVDHASAQSKFYTSPSTSGTFSWSGNTMFYYPSGQSYLTHYDASVTAGVKSIRGLDSAQAFSTSYTTQTPVNILSMPLYRQQHILSCELAALRMALTVKGVNVSEDELIGRVAKSDGDAKTADNKWGNPYQGFVGNVDGNGTTTGYGVYWDPIAALANQYRPAHAFTGGSPQTLANAIDSGSAVVIWGAIRNPSRMDWTDIVTGQTIYAVKGEHARTVKGYRGLASNPLGFYVSDPIYGNLYWDTGTLLDNWGWF